MADAIPVTSKNRKVVNVAAPVNASPTLDENGKVTMGEYSAKTREGLGDGSEFGPGAKSRVKTQLEIATKVDGEGRPLEIAVFTHRATRTDH